MRFLMLTLIAVMYGCILSSRAEAASSGLDLSLTFMLKSRHHYEPSGGKRFNESHNGVGLTWSMDQTYNHTVMHYRNSLNRNSWAYSVQRDVWCSDINICLGWSVSAATNYSERNPFGIALMPAITLNWGYFRSMHLPGVVSAYGLEVPLQ